MTDDPQVAQIVPSTYIGHVIMYTNNKVMTIEERENIAPKLALLLNSNLENPVAYAFISIVLAPTWTRKISSHTTVWL